MSEPIWISQDLALAIHARQIAEHGGIEGIRDEGLLSSALARPQQLMAYSSETPSIAELAAAYAYEIAQNLPFMDGNKRTSAVVCESFININGCELTADDKSMYQTFYALAEGTLSEKELVAWLQEHVV